MPWIFRYFWFLAAAFMLAYVLIWRSRSEEAVSAGVVSREEFDEFIRWASVWLIGLPLLLGVISLVAGWPSPFCARIPSFSDLPHALFSIVVLLAWASMLWWVWRGSGAEFIAHVLPRLNPSRTADRTYSPAVVRVVVTAIVIVSGVITPIVWRVTPMPPDLSCPASIIAG